MSHESLRHQNRTRHSLLSFRYPSRRSFACLPLRRRTCPTTCGYFFDFCPVGCTLTSRFGFGRTRPKAARHKTAAQSDSVGGLARRCRPAGTTSGSLGPQYSTRNSVICALPGS
jgi:hypothetical protein